MTDPSPTHLDFAAVVEEMALDYGRQWAASVQARLVIRQQAEQLARRDSEQAAPQQGGSRVDD